MPIAGHDEGTGRRQESDVAGFKSKGLSFAVAQIMRTFEHSQSEQIASQIVQFKASADEAPHADDRASRYPDLAMAGIAR